MRQIAVCRLAVAGSLAVTMAAGASSPGSSPGQSATGEKAAQKVAATVTLGANHHPCSGPACGKVNLTLVNGCAWLTNIGSKEVKVTVHVATESLDFVLPGAKELPPEKKDDEVDRARAAADVAHKAFVCRRARRAAEALKTIHRTLADAPELAATLRDCPPVESSASAAKATSRPSKSPDYGYSRHVDAFSGQRSEVYVTKVKTADGCVSNLNDITDYVAE